MNSEEAADGARDNVDDEDSGRDMDPWKRAGMQTSQNMKMRPAKRHALLIALGPD